jgi:hypothetical protein
MKVKSGSASGDYPHDHGSDALDNLLAVLTEEDREAALSENAAAFFDIQVPAVSCAARRPGALRQSPHGRTRVPLWAR